MLITCLCFHWFHIAVKLETEPSISKPLLDTPLSRAPRVGAMGQIFELRESTQVLRTPRPLLSPTSPSRWAWQVDLMPALGVKRSSFQMSHMCSSSPSGSRGTVCRRPLQELQIIPGLLGPGCCLCHGRCTETGEDEGWLCPTKVSRCIITLGQVLWAIIHMDYFFQDGQLLIRAGES